MWQKLTGRISISEEHQRILCEIKSLKKQRNELVSAYASWFFIAGIFCIWTVFPSLSSPLSTRDRERLSHIDSRLSILESQLLSNDLIASPSIPLPPSSSSTYKVGPGG